MVVVVAVVVEDVDVVVVWMVPLLMISWEHMLSAMLSRELYCSAMGNASPDLMVRHAAVFEVFHVNWDLLNGVRQQWFALSLGASKHSACVTAALTAWHPSGWVKLVPLQILGQTVHCLSSVVEPGATTNWLLAALHVCFSVHLTTQLCPSSVASSCGVVAALLIRWTMSAAADALNAVRVSEALATSWFHGQKKPDALPGSVAAHSKTHS